MIDRVAVMIRYDTPVVPLRFRPLLAPPQLPQQSTPPQEKKYKKKFKTKKKTETPKTFHFTTLPALSLASRLLT